MSDHAPLCIMLPAPGSRVPVTRWGIRKYYKDKEAFLGDLSESFQLLSPWEGNTIAKVSAIVNAISLAFSKAWSTHAKEFRLGKHSKSWWNKECAETLMIYQESRLPEDWSQYCCAMQDAKWEFFESCVTEIASANHRLWDLTGWTRKCNLPSHEAISYRGAPCNELGELWAALDGTYNATGERAVDLSFMDPLEPLPPRDWLPFSTQELLEALSACSSCSAPGPDHIMWSYLKHLCRLPGVAQLFTRIAEACLTLGHWPTHFKSSLSVIIPKPGKPSYSTPKSFWPIVLLNTLGKLIQKMLACQLQFDGVAHDVFHPNQFGGIAQRSTEDAGVYLTHLMRAGWAKGLVTSVVAFDIAQFSPSINHSVLLEVIACSGFPPCVGNFFCAYLVGRVMTYKWDNFTSGTFPSDVGVGQGSALSPVLSALCLAPVLKLFGRSTIGRWVDLMSYVDDGTLIVSSRKVEDNLPLLKEAYGFVHQLSNI